MTERMDRHQRRRVEAREELAALPTRLDELAHCLTEHGASTDGGGQRKVTGSPAPLRLDVLHLVDERQKPRWDGEDPRLRDLRDRYGVLPTLGSWTRVMAEDMLEHDIVPDLPEPATIHTETAVLIEHWDWITEQEWVDKLVDDVLNICGQVRIALGIRREYRPHCRYCRNSVIPVDHLGTEVSGWDQAAYGSCIGCGETYPKGPALDALAKVQDPMPLKAISDIIGVPVKTLHRWDKAGVIQPAPEGKRRGRVFDLDAVRMVATRVYQRDAAG